MIILSEGCKPDNFEDATLENLSSANIWGHSNFDEYESFIE